MMYGQMTAGSWIYIGSQGIVQGTYETFAEMGRRHYGGDLNGKWILTAGLGGMGGAQPLAASMAGASLLAVECRPSSIEFRLRTGYVDVQAKDLDEALAIIERATKEKKAVSVALLGNADEVMPASCAAALSPTSSPTRPPPMIPSMAICRGGGHSPNGRSGARAILRAWSAPQRRRWPSMCGRCSPTLTPAFRLSTTATTSARWRSTRASRTRSISRASFRPISGRCSAAESGRSAGRPCRAIRGHLQDRRQGQGLMPGDPHLHNWLDMARTRIKFQGLPARICWVGLGDRHRLGLAFNAMVASGELTAPIVIGRDHLDSGSLRHPTAKPKRCWTAPTPSPTGRSSTRS